MNHSSSARVQRLTLLTHSALLLWIFVWRASLDWTLNGVLWAIALCIPLLLPLRGLWLGKRYTFAWATLCVIAYFILGLTEVVANPHGRWGAAGCLLLALLLFVLLILFLRVSPMPTSEDQSARKMP